jgi:hypothetical protein
MQEVLQESHALVLPATSPTGRCKPDALSGDYGCDSTSNR